MSAKTEFHSANLAHFLGYTDGRKPQEIEGDILRVAFQTPGLTKYDRQNGGGFENIEQARADSVTQLLFSRNLIESVYRMNEERRFDPFVVLGYEDVTVEANRGSYELFLSYRLIDDLFNPMNLRAAV